MKSDRKVQIAKIIAFAALSLAAGCSRGSDKADTETNSSQAEVSVPIPNEQAAPAIPATSNLAEANAVPPEPPLSEDAQMMEDAEATGMTSRMASGQAEAPGNEAARDMSGQ